MGQGDYELEVLLELREQARDEAREQLAAEVGELERLRQRAQALADELEAAEAERERQCARFDRKCAAGEVGVAQLQTFDDYVRGLRQSERELARRVTDAREDARAQQLAVEAARAELSRTVRELKAVEAHREDWEQQRQQRARRKQDAAMDEVAARLWREGKER